MKIVSWIAVLLTCIGAINWGLVGVGMFLETNLNLVNLALGSIPTAEYIVYILVGVSGLMVLYAHLAKKCNMCECSAKD